MTQLNRKSILRSFLNPCLPVLLAVFATHAAEVTITVENPPAQGTLTALFFDSPNSFGDLREPVATYGFEAAEGATCRINDLAPGEYALLLYFDENGNGRLDRNFIGIPKEPLGFANAYRPKGPPSYARACFTLRDDALSSFQVLLRRPLGKRGRVGIGIGALGQSSPYRGFPGGTLQVIPALTYMGERLLIFGPEVQFGLAGSGDLRLAAVGSYRMGTYAEDDSPYLAGMGDRKDTFMAGLAVQLDLPGGLDLSMRYKHDLLDEIGGGSAALGLSKSFRHRTISLSPGLDLKWTSAKLANHDFGVSVAQATAERPAYLLDDTFNFEAGLTGMVEITPNWLGILRIGVEWLDDAIGRSPLIDDNYVINAFMALNYAL